MLTFDYNEEKCIVFGITGAMNFNESNAKIFARLNIDGVDYSFPGKFVNDSIHVTIPALSDVLKEASTDKKYGIVMEVIVDETYLVPYEDDFKIEIPTKLQVEMVEDKTVTKKAEMSLTITEENTNKQKRVKEWPKPEGPPNEIIDERDISDKFLDI